MISFYFLRLIRSLCYYPLVGRNVHRAIAILMMYSPGLNTRTRWKVISRDLWEDEINRSFYRNQRASGPIVSRYELRLHTRPMRNFVAAILSGGNFDAISVTNGMIISGDVPAGKGDRIYLQIDDIVVAERALTPQRRGFSIKFKEEFIEKFPVTSVMRIRTDKGVKLQHGGLDHIILEQPCGDGSLASIFDEGVKLNKKGLLSGSVSSSVYVRQAEYIEEYLQFSEVFERVVGKSIFLSYGTLLGCIREGSVIPHDDDFDLSYFSEHTNGKSVRDEILVIRKLMMAEGYNLQAKSGGRFNRFVRGNSDIALGFMPIWMHDGHLVLYQGKRIKCEPDDIIPVNKAQMGSYTVSVPNNPEVFLRGFYGKGWSVPDPGFSHDKLHSDKLGHSLWNATRFTPREMKAIGYPVSF